MIDPITHYILEFKIRYEIIEYQVPKFKPVYY